MAKRNINLPYIRKVLRFIEHGPRERFSMYTFGRAIPKEEARKNGWPKCGTKACFAGWGVLIQQKPSKWYAFLNRIHRRSRSLTIEATANKLFGFTATEGYIVYSPNGCHAGNVNDLPIVKERINRVLEGRGMKERV